MAKSRPELIVAIPVSTACAAARTAAVPTPIGMAIDCPSEAEAMQRVFGEYYDPHHPRDPSAEPLSPRVDGPAREHSPHYQPTYAPSKGQEDDMAEQLRRAEVVTAALDREIARLKAQLEALGK